MFLPVDACVPHINQSPVLTTWGTSVVAVYVVEVTVLTKKDVNFHVMHEKVYNL
jgi:hypothetical protein